MPSPLPSISSFAFKQPLNIALRFISRPSQHEQAKFYKNIIHRLQLQEIAQLCKIVHPEHLSKEILASLDAVIVMWDCGYLTEESWLATEKAFFSALPEQVPVTVLTNHDSLHMRFGSGRSRDKTSVTPLLEMKTLPLNVKRILEDLIMDSVVLPAHFSVMTMGDKLITDKAIRKTITDLANLSKQIRRQRESDVKQASKE